MAFLKRHKEGLIAADPTVLGTVGLGARYGKVKRISARNWASSAKAAAGTDALEKIELKDADGIIFFLDVADRDYKTARVDLSLAYDDLNTGLGFTQVTGIGSLWVATEGQAIEPPIVKGPITITIRNGTTATDWFEIDLFVEI
jgi:hypothetical protein